MKASTKINLALAAGIGLACIAGPASATYNAYYLNVGSAWNGGVDAFTSGPYYSQEACEAAGTAWKAGLPASYNAYVKIWFSCSPREAAPVAP